MSASENLAYFSYLSWELLDKVDLDENARNYEVLKQPTTRKEELAIGKIEEMLLDGLAHPLDKTRKPDLYSKQRHQASRSPAGRQVHSHAAS